MTTDPREPPSILLGLVNWLVFPLILGLVLIGLVVFVVARGVSDETYDRALGDTLNHFVQYLGTLDRRSGSRLTVEARAFLASDLRDVAMFQIRNVKGELIAASDGPDLPVAPRDAPLGETRYFDTTVDDVEWRVAYRSVRFEFGGEPVEWQIQLAETTHERDRLARSIVKGVILPLSLLVPAIGIIAGVVILRGLIPLNRIGQKVRERAPRDFSAIEEEGAPREVAPLIEAFNDLVARFRNIMQIEQRFVGDAAHQLRTPLAGLKTQAQLARSETDPRALQSSLVQIERSVDRMHRLINQLLTSARADFSRESPLAEEIDLNALLRELAEDFAPRVLERRVEFSFDAAPGSARVKGSPLMLREMASNLLDNALRYTPAGGAIQLAVFADEARCGFAVEDTGPGIPAEHREKVFERFYRVPGMDVEGSGLGLAIARTVADAHGGDIALLEGAQGKGLRVVVTFPREVSPVAYVEPAPARARDTATGTQERTAPAARPARA